MKPKKAIAITLLPTLALLASACTSTDDPEGESEPISVVFQSKWFPQAQFAGYYIAGGFPADADGSIDAELSERVPRDEEGRTFYEAENLLVSIVPGVVGNDFFDPSERVATGAADFGTDWIANMVRNVEANRYDLKHVAQVFQRSGFEMVAPASSGITSLDDFGEPRPNGDTTRVGIWLGGNEFPVMVCLRQAGLLTDLETVNTPQEGQENVETVSYAFDPALVFPAVQDEAITICEHNGGDACDQLVDVASAMVYNELNQIIGHGYGLNDLVRFNATDEGCGLLEDFIFTTAELLESDDFKGSGVSGREVAERFVRASMRGWSWTVDNEDASVDIVLDYCGATCAGSGSTDSPEIHQGWQMAEVNKLVRPDPSVTVGCLDDGDYDATIQRLNDIRFFREGLPEGIRDPAVLREAGINCP